ncbi:MAG: glycosyltransferase [Microcystaceae cyanobacterium]
MKVLIFGLISGQGGIQTHLYWLSKALLESGHQVSIITPQLIPLETKDFFKTSTNLNIISLDSVINPQAQVSVIPIQRFYLYKNLLNQVRNFSPNIFIGLGTGWIMSMISLSLPSTTRKIFHEVMSGKTSNKRDPRWGVKYTFTEVVAQAKDVGKNFQENFSWSQFIPVLPAFPEPLEITAEIPTVSPKVIPLGQAKAALFSRLVSHKKAFWLVQQWDFLQHYLGELHIHGGGPEEELINDYIATKNIGDRVKCWGKYPDGQDYVNLLSSYDLTLLPTVGAEGSPLVLLESMACGVPFVAYGVGGITDYGQNNPDAIVVPPEPWLTTQARNYTLTTPAGENQAFLNAVKMMAEQLSMGLINQSRLQQFYLKNYSYEVLKKRWLDYLLS